MLAEEGADMLCDFDLSDDELSDDDSPLGGQSLLGLAAARGDTEVVKALLPQAHIDRTDRKVGDSLR